MIVGDLSDSAEEDGSAGKRSVRKVANGEATFCCQLPPVGLFRGRHHILSQAHADFPGQHVRERLASALEIAEMSSFS